MPEKIILKLGEVVAQDAEGRPAFLIGFRKLRTLPLNAKDAYGLALAAGVIDREAAAYQAAALSAIKKHGGIQSGDRWEIPATNPNGLNAFLKEMDSLKQQSVELPLEGKVNLPAEVQVSADDLIPVLGLVAAPTGPRLPAAPCLPAGTAQAGDYGTTGPRDHGTTSP